MKLNFNQAPYFNDFDPSDNYTRVLFKDGVPLQTRELNNIQDISQEQLKKFGNHIFKNGSRVSGARFREITYDYIILNPISPWDGKSISLELLSEGVLLKGQVTQLRATVTKSAEVDGKLMVYLVYNGTAVDGETREFINGETIDVIDENEIPYYRFSIPCPSCEESSSTADVQTTTQTGKGTLFIIEEGIFYFGGMFVDNDKQDIIVSPFEPISTSTNIDRFSIGFDIIETISTSEDDASLYDNSLGYPNKTSPGADRYKIELRLSKKPTADVKADEFITLAEYIGQSRTFTKADSEYSDVMDFIAKRTYEESGNYAIKPQGLRFLEHKMSKAGDPRGFDINGSDDNFVCVVSPNIYYVNGYRHEDYVERFVITPKARNTKKLRSYIHQFEEFNYIFLKPKAGTSAYPNSPITPHKVYDQSIIELYDGVVSTGPGGSFLPSGSKIGTLKIFDMKLESGIPGSGNAIYRYYIHAVNFVNNKTLADVRSIYHPTNKFICDPVLEDGALKVHGNGKAELIWKIKKDHIKSLRDHNNSESGSLVITHRTKLMGTTDSQGIIIFTSEENEAFSDIDSTSVACLTTNGVPATIDLSSFNVIQTPTSITIDLGQSNSGKEFLLITNAVSTKTKERTKRVQTNTDTITAPTETIDMYLSKADIKQIISIVAYPKGQLLNTQTHINIPLHLFNFNNGQTDYSYTNGWIRMKPGSQFPDVIHSDLLKYNIIVTYSYYEHSGVNGPFNIDSYESAINEGSLTYSDVPVYKAMSGIDYPLAFCLDFRPLILNGVMNQSLIPTVEQLAFFDMEYYLPRCDIVQTDKFGNITTKLGIPTDSPVPPKASPDNMVLFELWCSPYTYTLDDIKYKRIENKRYTMKDIGRLDKRLQKVEYYTVLNTLEKSAKDLSIKDSNGYDQFKNGFIADNFKDFQAGDINNEEFNAAIDRTREELRPSFNAYNRKLEFDPTNSARYAITGGMITLPFVSVLIDEQPYATKNVSVNPYYMYTKSGTMVLTPNNDTWVNTTTIPDQVITQDFGTEAMESMTNRLNSDWGAWNDANRTGVGPATTTTIATTTNGNPTAGARIDTYDFGSRLTDVALSYYAREVDIEFTCSKMAKNTKLYAFFDGKPVSAYCRPIDGLFGDQLRTDSNGIVRGVFRIPPETFRIGVNIFRLTGNKTNSTDFDMLITWAESSFFSGGIDQTSQGITLNAITPTFNYDTRLEGGIDVVTVANDWTGTRITNNITNIVSQQIASIAPPDLSEFERRMRAEVQAAANANTRARVSELAAEGGRLNAERVQARSDIAAIARGFPPVPPERVKKAQELVQLMDNVGLSSEVDMLRGPGSTTIDPLAQSFKLDNSSFITKLVLYFSQIDTELTYVFVELRPMVNGYPSSNVILAHKEYDSTELTISEDSLTPFEVIFDSPVYVEGGTEYCFVVGGFSPNTRLWVARMGDTLINDPTRIVETQPTLGSSFRSQNATTWNAEQFEDIKYQLYVADFTERSMELAFNISTESIELPSNSLEFESGSNRIRVFMNDHGNMAGDSITLYPLTTSTITIESSSRPDFGATITTPTGSIKIHNMVSNNTANQYIITIINLQGNIQTGQSFISGAITGTIISGVPQTINGIPIQEIAKSHTILTVDSRKSFVIQTTTNSNFTGMGGSGISIESNTSYNVLNPSCSYMKYTCTENWTHEGVTYNPYSSPNLLSDYSRRSPMPVLLSADNHTSQPYKLVINGNSSKIDNDYSHKTCIKGYLTSPSRYLSPILNPETMSVTLVSNRISHESDIMNVGPNSSYRYKEETHPSSGSELFKYLTRPILLKKPSADLYILFDAYRDLNAEFFLYYRFNSPEDITDITTHNWIPIPIETNVAVGQEKTEYGFRLSEIFESTWADHPMISTFQIKIVGRSVNSSNPPLFQNLRVIAIT